MEIFGSLNPKKKFLSKWNKFINQEFLHQHELMKRKRRILQ